MKDVAPSDQRRRDPCGNLREDFGAASLPTVARSSQETQLVVAMRAMTERARLLRASSTPTERILWEALRDRRLAGTKWRRQQKLGRFIVDFFCADRALAVEIDGAVHVGREDLDAERQAILERSGVRVARFTVSEVQADLPGVLSRIASLMAGTWNE